MCGNPAIVVFKVAQALSVNQYMSIPKPKSTELNEELLAIQHRGHFLDTSSLEYRQLDLKLRKQIKDEPFSGYGLYAAFCGLTGDVEGLRDYYKKAQALTAEPQLRVNNAIGLANLGFFSEAALHLPFMERPENGFLRDAINVSLETGRIARAARLIGKWNELHQDEPKDLGCLTAAAVLLEKSGVSDDGLLPCLDIVGAIMREHRLIFIREPLIALIQGESSEQISFRFLVKIEPEDAASLNYALVDRLFDSGVPLHDHVVHFGYLAVGDEVQRLAA